MKLKNEKEQLKKEFHAFIRHLEFVSTAETYSTIESIQIDWDCYWSHYYHSKVNAKTALMYSIIDEDNN